MAEETGGGLLEGLQGIPDNMSIFDGVPDQDRQRAIMATALQLMRPQDPLKGGGDGQIAEALSRSLGAGLTELDTRQDRGLDQQNQEVQRRVGESTINLNADRGESRVRTSKANESNAAVNAQAEERAASEFAEEANMRKAIADLRVAEAEWLRRRHDGTPAGSASKDLELKKINDMASVLKERNPARYARADGTVNEALARVDAYEELGLEELLSNPSLPIIVGTTEEAQAIRERVKGLTSNFAGEDDLARGDPITITDQADLDAKIDSGEIAPGDTVIFNGVERTVQ